MTTAIIFPLIIDRSPEYLLSFYRRMAGEMPRERHRGAASGV
jgi:hypothetical protein